MIRFGLPFGRSPAGLDGEEADAVATSREGCFPPASLILWSPYLDALGYGLAVACEGQHLWPLPASLALKVRVWDFACRNHGRSLNVLAWPSMVKASVKAELEPPQLFTPLCTPSTIDVVNA